MPPPLAPPRPRKGKKKKRKDRTKQNQTHKKKDKKIPGKILVINAMDIHVCIRKNMMMDSLNCFCLMTMEVFKPMYL
jgi:hypothetical protein